MRILLVEDNAVVRKSVAETFLDLGHKVAEAVSAEEALQVLEQTSHDILITDQGLPGMSGLDLLHTVSQRFPAMKLVLMSGEMLPDEQKHQWLFLGKPFSFDDLAQLCREAPP